MTLQFSEYPRFRRGCRCLILAGLLTLPACTQSESPVSEASLKPAVQLPDTRSFSLTPEQTQVGPIIENSLGMVFVPIPAGSFLMGSPETAVVRQDEEVPHQVTISRPCYLAVFAVTQEQYQRVMETNPSQAVFALNPVESVSWDQAVAFCEQLSALPAERRAGRSYRLPTEAEWEYACRAGSTTAYSCGDDEQTLRDFAWFNDNADRQTHPVGQKLPNRWGLYDMHGNVFEWCQDVWEDWTPVEVTDPLGLGVSSIRVARGGSWFCPSGQLVRSAFRHAFPRDLQTYYIGFRVLMTPDS